MNIMVNEHRRQRFNTAFILTVIFLGIVGLTGCTPLQELSIGSRAQRQHITEISASLSPQEIQQYFFLVGEATSIELVIISDQPNVSISLLDPLDQVVATTVTSAEPIEGALTFEGQYYARLETEAPIEGEWLAQVTASHEQTILTISIQAVTTALLSVDSEPGPHIAGESAVFHAALRQGFWTLQPILMQMDVYQGDNVLNTYQFRDDGVYPDETASDGVYSLAVPDQGRSGLLSGVIQARKGNIQREERTSFSFIQLTAHLIGVTGEALVDEDNDGLAEALAINVGVEVRETGQYILNAYLDDENGQPVAYAQINTAFNRLSSGDQVFSQGTHTFQLLFPGSQIRNHGVDGPYFVRLILEDIVQGGATVDASSESYQTVPYQVSRFAP